MVHPQNSAVRQRPVSLPRLHAAPSAPVRAFDEPARHLSAQKAAEGYPEPEIREKRCEFYAWMRARAQLPFPKTAGVRSCVFGPSMRSERFGWR